MASKQQRKYKYREISRPHSPISPDLRFASRSAVRACPIIYMAVARKFSSIALGTRPLAIGDLPLRIECLGASPAGKAAARGACSSLARRRLRMQRARRYGAGRGGEGPREIKEKGQQCTAAMRRWADVSRNRAIMCELHGADARVDNAI